MFYTFDFQEKYLNLSTEKQGFPNDILKTNVFYHRILKIGKI